MSHHLTFVQGLREAGFRMTPQREMILSVICDGGGHITADAILKRVRDRYPYLNKSAVYRTLDLLTQLGLVNPTDFGSGCIEYELHEHPHHHHLLCRHCGRRIQVQAEVFAPLEKALYARYGFSPDLDHFAIFGTCRQCRRSAKSRGLSAHPNHLHDPLHRSARGGSHAHS